MKYEAVLQCSKCIEEREPLSIHRLLKRTRYRPSNFFKLIPEFFFIVNEAALQLYDTRVGGGRAPRRENRYRSIVSSPFTIARSAFRPRPSLVGVLEVRARRGASFTTGADDESANRRDSPRPSERKRAGEPGGLSRAGEAQTTKRDSPTRSARPGRGRRGGVARRSSKVDPRSDGLAWVKFSHTITSFMCTVCHVRIYQFRTATTVSGEWLTEPSQHN